MKHTHLVKLENIEQVKEFAVFFAVLQLAVILLQAMQSQLCLVVHKHLHRLHTHTQSCTSLNKLRLKREVYTCTQTSLLNNDPELQATENHYGQSDLHWKEFLVIPVRLHVSGTALNNDQSVFYRII